MNIKKYIFRFAMMLITFALGYGACAEYRYLESCFRTQPLDTTISPLKDLDASDVPTVEIYRSEVADTQSPTNSGITESSPVEDFDPTGSYYLSDEKPPRGFEDFKYLEIATRKYGSETTDYLETPIPPTGRIFAKRSYNFKSVAISPTDIAFQTKTVNGVSYKFVGKFAPQAVGDSCATAGGTADIHGKLTKIKDGKTIATKKVEFNADCGC